MNKTDFNIIQANAEELKKYMNSLALQQTNIQMDEKCISCPYMFEYKCQNSSCVFDEVTRTESNVKSDIIMTCKKLLSDVYVFVREQNEQNEQKCINCKHRPIDNGPDRTPKTPVNEYADLSFDEPEPIDWDYTCPYVCGDSWYNRMPKDDDFCSKFEKKE